MSRRIILALPSVCSHARRRGRFSLVTTPFTTRSVLTLLLAGAAAMAGHAQDAAQVGDRLRGLQREAEQLAREARTLVGDLRRLEVERDLRRAEAAQAAQAAAAMRDALAAATGRLAALQVQRQAEAPDLTAQLVDIYKHGRAGYVEALIGARDLREFARAARSLAALRAIAQRRLSQHRRLLDDMARERAQIEQTAGELATRDAAARQASLAADQAVSSRAALAREIDARRDLTAQYLGELQAVFEQLQRQVVPAGGESIAVPLLPFRGALDWPVDGRVVGRFADPNRLGGPAARNGIDIGAAAGAPAHAVHGGVASFAGVFSGFGTLVILDHGGNSYSLYGYLASTPLMRGDRVAAGVELGRVGSAPGGPPALYFELRIDGRAVDPLQWLRKN